MAANILKLPAASPCTRAPSCPSRLPAAHGCRRPSFPLLIRRHCLLRPCRSMTGHLSHGSAPPQQRPRQASQRGGTDGRGCGLDGAAPWSCSAATGTLGPPPRARPMPPSELTCRPSRAPQNSTVHHGGPARSFPCRFHYRSAILPSKLLFSSVDCDRTKGTRDRNKNTCECGWVRVRVTRARAGRRVGMAGGYKPMGVKSIAFLAENALPITILCVFHPIPNYLTGGSNVRDKMSSIWMRKVFQIIQSL